MGGYHVKEIERVDTTNDGLMRTDDLRTVNLYHCMELMEWTDTVQLQQVFYFVFAAYEFA